MTEMSIRLSAKLSASLVNVNVSTDRFFDIVRIENNTTGAVRARAIAFIAMYRKVRLTDDQKSTIKTAYAHLLTECMGHSTYQTFAATNGMPALVSVACDLLYCAIMVPEWFPDDDTETTKQMLNDRLARYMKCPTGEYPVDTFLITSATAPAMARLLAI